MDKRSDDLFSRGTLVTYTTPGHPNRPCEELTVTYLGAWFVGQRFRRHRIELTTGKQRYVSAAALSERRAHSASTESSK